MEDTKHWIMVDIPTVCVQEKSEKKTGELGQQSLKKLKGLHKLKSSALGAVLHMGNLVCTVWEWTE